MQTEGIEHLFNKMIAEVFQNFGKDMGLQEQ
jgi:hypothetical protein